MKKLRQFFDTYYPGSATVVSQFKQEGNQFVYRAPLTGNQFILIPVGGRKKNEFQCERLSSRGNRIPSKLHDWEKDPKLRLEIVTGVTKDPNLKTWKSLNTFLSHENRVKKVCSMLYPAHSNIRQHEFAFDFPKELRDNMSNLNIGKWIDLEIQAIHFPEDGVVVFEMNNLFHMDSLPSFYDKLIHALKAAL